MNKDNLPFVFIVVFCDFVAFSVAWNWHPWMVSYLYSFFLHYINIWDQRCKILCFMKHFYRSLESSRRALPKTVNVWDHMSRVTSRSVEQFRWSPSAQIPSTCLKSHMAVTQAEISAHPKKTPVTKTSLHLKLIVYFPLQAWHYHAVCKDVHVCGGTFVRLLPDVDRYDVQRVVLYSCCDWSRAGLLHYNSTYRFTYFKQ